MSPSRIVFVIIALALIALILLVMLRAWNARKRRDAGIPAPATVLSGEILDAFPLVAYVSTTPAGAPFDRVVIPGLGFKGWAEVAVRRDGVSIAVTGERPVSIAAARLTGVGTANARVGKAVESDGLSLLRWRAADDTTADDTTAEPRELESGFRFSDAAEQQRFADAVAQIVPIPGPDGAGSAQTQTPPHTTQEDA